MRASLATLAATWRSAFEVMLDVPGLPGRTVIAPRQTDDVALEIPAVFRAHVVFGLTAFDPPGVSRSLEENTAANFRLWEALQHSMALITRPGCPVPLVWRSFGVHVEDAWREDGFCVAFQPATATVAAAHDAVLRIARQFEQGAVYRYDIHDGDRLVRQTVPVSSTAGADVYSAVEVVHVSLLPSLMAGPLLERPWAGPHDLPLAHDSHGSTATSSPAYQDPDRR